MGTSSLSLAQLVLIENQPIGTVFIIAYNFPLQPTFTVAHWLVRLHVTSDSAGSSPRPANSKLLTNMVPDSSLRSPGE